MFRVDQADAKRVFGADTILLPFDIGAPLLTPSRDPGNEQSDDQRSYQSCEQRAHYCENQSFPKIREHRIPALGKRTPRSPLHPHGASPAIGRMSAGMSFDATGGPHGSGPNCRPTFSASQLRLDHVLAHGCALNIRTFDLALFAPRGRHPLPIAKGG